MIPKRQAPAALHATTLQAATAEAEGSDRQARLGKISFIRMRYNIKLSSGFDSNQ